MRYAKFTGAFSLRLAFPGKGQSDKSRTMSILQSFLAYAGDFEKTLTDDDWTRLRQYFADDAVYEVKAKSFGCRLQGPDAIFKGMKKSLDGFDRKFEGRNIKVSSGPEVDASEIRMSWEVTFAKAGWTPYVLRGRSVVRYGDGKIVYLGDAYEPSMEEAALAWQRDNGVELDPSYT